MYYSTTQTIYINKYINNHMCLEICLHSLGYLYENFFLSFIISVKEFRQGHRWQVLYLPPSVDLLKHNYYYLKITLPILYKTTKCGYAFWSKHNKFICNKTMYS